MDKWVSDDSVFISRSIGSSDGVAQVYKLCLSTDIPLGEDSFSFIGEAAVPLTIAPLVQWPWKNYLRLLDFIQVNSLMVNASGYVILKSTAKSRIVGRPDHGLTTYWRCLDMLPMQIYGLRKPQDIGIKPDFLIIGGDVDQLNTTTTDNTDDVAEVREWKVKYENWDAAYKSLKSELDELKVRLALADHTLIVSQGENNKLGDEMEVERKKASEERDKLTAEISNLLHQLGESVPRSVMEDNLKNEEDAWIVKLARKSIFYCFHADKSEHGMFFKLKDLETCSDIRFTEEQPMRGRISKLAGAEWNVYGDGKSTYAITVAPYKDNGKYVWSIDHFSWESNYNTGRLVFSS